MGGFLVFIYFILRFTFLLITCLKQKWFCILPFFFDTRANRSIDIMKHWSSSEMTFNIDFDYAGNSLYISIILRKNFFTIMTLDITFFFNCRTTRAFTNVYYNVYQQVLLVCYNDLLTGHLFFRQSLLIEGIHLLRVFLIKFFAPVINQDENRSYVGFFFVCEFSSRDIFLIYYIFLNNFFELMVHHELIN